MAQLASHSVDLITVFFKKWDCSRKRRGKVNSEECSLALCTQLPDRCGRIIKEAAVRLTAVL